MKSFQIKYNFFLSLFSLIINKGKIPTQDYQFKLEKYTGLNGEKAPMHIYYSKKKSNKTVIIFLGASPDGEKHTAINNLAKIIAKFGYNVFIPRIPPLMDLDISNKNVNWITYLYDLLKKREDIDPDHINTLGISYGGGMLLKASLKDEMNKQAPKSIFLYGAGCNAKTILSFITNGEFENNGKVSKIAPHDWGLTVFFHHFIDDIDFGFDNSNIKQVLQYRVNNEKTKAHKKLEELNEVEYNIANAIISGEINDEVQKIVDIIIKDKKDYIEDLSCQHICKDVSSKVFILHGANDNMIPFTESVQLNQLLPNSELLISFLFEHKGISSKRSIFFKLKELVRLVQFLFRFHKFNAS